MRIVPALDRGLRVLSLLTERRSAMAQSALARELDIPRSAIYEIVNTLAAHHCVQVGPDGHVSLGPQVFAWGGAFVADMDLVSIAQPIAVDVMVACQETVQVGVLDDADVLYLVKAESPQAVRLVSHVGSRLPAHCTALGKVLLASLPGDELDALLSRGPLSSLTESSVSDPDLLRRDLDRVRSVGLAWEDGESNPEVMCVASAVRDGTGRVCAAMSVSAPRSRLGDPDRRREIGEQVAEGARRLSRSLGHTG